MDSIWNGMIDLFDKYAAEETLRSKDIEIEMRRTTNLMLVIEIGRAQGRAEAFKLVANSLRRGVEEANAEKS